MTNNDESPDQVGNVGAAEPAPYDMPPEYLRSRLGVLTSQQAEAQRALETQQANLHVAASDYANAKQRVAQITGEIDRTADILARRVYEGG